VLDLECDDQSVETCPSDETRFQVRSPPQSEGQWVTATLYNAEPLDLAEWVGSRRRFFEPRRIAYALIAIGMLLQAVRWSSNRSFWEDEAALALNIRGRSFAELARPLGENQAAPIGFLCIEKLALNILGDDERGLRLFPCLSAVAALWLAHSWFRSVLGPRDTALAMGLFALQPRLIEYAAELKPYSFDVAAALLVLLIDLRMRQNRFGGPWLIAWVVSGLLLPWLSFPVVFVLAASAFSTGWTLMKSGRWRLFITMICAWAFWATSWGWQVSLLREAAANEANNHWWAAQFVPCDRGVSGALCWVATSWIELFRTTMKTMPAWLAAVVAGIGLFLFVRRRTRASGMIIGVLVAALIAAACHRYPLGDRLALYLLPLLSVSLAAALGAMEQTQSRFLQLSARILAMIFLGGAFGRSCIEFVNQGHREESRPVLQQLAANGSTNDPVYVYRMSRHAFDYYSQRFHLRMKAVYGTGIAPLDDPQVRDLLVRGRVWLFFAHGWKLGSTSPARNVQTEFLEYANSLARRIDRVEARGAAAFLYEPVATASDQAP
jgi:Dolichyl-phosphate-mannose-protein mannosyltransferase